VGTCPNSEEKKEDTMSKPQMWDLKARDAQARKQKAAWEKRQRTAPARAALRLQRLSAPITPERIATFVKHLVAIPLERGGECWLYSGSEDTSTLELSTSKYATLTFNGERGVQVHRFAQAAATGVTIASLTGFDVHHAYSAGHCIGYLCCNPAHLQTREKPREHRGTRGVAGSLARYQTRLAQTAMGLTYRDRHQVTGSDAKKRSFAGTSFQIRVGIICEIIYGEDCNAPVFEE
jgi:hypothetical protein